MALCPEHPKRDQNPKFSPLSETTSIPVYFIWESPTPGEHICGEPIWRPEKSVNIWNLLWLSWLLIICTEQTGIYIRTFPNAITNKKAQNHEISRSLPFVTHSHNSEIQNALVSKRSTLLSFMPDEDENFRGSLVVDFRK